MPLTFISYSRKDISFSSQLRTDLLRNNIPVWRDKDDIPPGINWDVAIQDVLTSGRVSHFLVALSPYSVNSNNVLDEISLAVDSNIEFIVPLLIADCPKIPLRIYRRNRIDFRQRPYTEAFDELLEVFVSQDVQFDEAPEQLEAAVVFVRKPTPQQRLAAHDEKSQVRLIAGPGTGKSFVIEERLYWLLSRGVSAASIFVVSFTRASSRELRERAIEYCKARGTSANKVSITTLHSLALTALCKARLLEEYPVEPRVLDTWELENVFDQEFSANSKKHVPELGNATPGRCKEIRLAYEALWSTGQWEPVNYVRPDIPISIEERQAFDAFLQQTARVYSCVLPGEIVKKCVDNIEEGFLEPVSLLRMGHFIVDEYQDLNHTDIEFIKSITSCGVATYVAGDDDQSIYSFRFAFPSGIQTFTSVYPQAGMHELQECFRCTPNVLETAKILISKYASPDRIPKTLFSHYEDTNPPIDGLVHRWRFKSDSREAKAIANSCKALVDRGVEPRDILILISNRRALLSPVRKGKPSVLENAFEDVGIELELSHVKRYIDTEDGRFAFAVIRVACDENLKDYVAHRLILGLPKGVGIPTCNNIRRVVIQKNLNYLDLFYNPLPSEVFGTREVKALDRARDTCSQVFDWKAEDTVNQRSGAIAQILSNAFGQAEADIWMEQCQDLPKEMNLKELTAYLSVDTDEQRIVVLEGIYKRLDIELPEDGFFPSKVRVMTMHGAKGLGAQVVFIPGLEADILPGQKRKKYPGLVLEAARMLYVSITRAGAACIMSYTPSRVSMGKRDQGRPPSPFNTALSGKFDPRDEQGLTDIEADQIVQTVVAMREQVIDTSFDGEA